MDILLLLVGVIMLFTCGLGLLTWLVLRSKKAVRVLDAWVNAWSDY